MQAFYVVNPHPTKKQRRELGELIGLDDTQIYFWNQRQKNKPDISSNEQMVNELIKKNEELTEQNKLLQVQNQNLIDALHNSICLQCGAPTPYPEVQQSQFGVIPPPLELPQLELPHATPDYPIDPSLL
jgi:hypothetical protein